MKVGKVVVSIICVVLMFLLYQLWLPTLGVGYASGFIFLGICAIVVSILIGWFLKSDYDEMNLTIPGIVIVIFFVILFIGYVGSGSLFNSTKMQQQLGEVTEHSFKDDIIPLDNSQIPTVDKALAMKQADKKLGEQSALGSQVEIGDFTIQQVNGKLMFVAPLEHTGLFKYNSNGSTPGYITVSATDSSKVELVRELDGKPIKLRYLESAFFGDDLKRHIRNLGYVNKGITSMTFELDDTGRPYWSVTEYKNTTFWSNPEATGIILCDAQTGEITRYNVDEVPEWVDAIHPENFIENQIDNWGKLIHGAINFSKKDMIKKTDDMITVYNEGKCYYYTGLTSVGADDSTVGFIMVDTRTKKAVKFVMNGATEDAAMRSAQGLVQDMGYKATEPLPLNINGIPTYFLTLKDDEGLVKKYGMVNIENYSIVVVADTIVEAKRKYMSTLNGTGNNMAFSSEAFAYTVQGVVTRISANVESGNTYYYIILDEDSEKLFMAPYTISDELTITREGDTVEISYITDSNGLIDIAKFDNVKFSQKLSEDQIKKNENKAESIIDDDTNKIIEVDPEKSNNIWEKLTDEEKAKLMENINKE